MPGETPDWGVLSARATVYPVTDLGELAARLGSPIAYHRGGDLVWWDDFEWGLGKWDQGTSGVGASVSLSTERARNGRTSCKLTGGSDQGRYAGITHESPVLVPSGLGVEWGVSLAGGYERLDWAMLYYTGVLYWPWRGRLNWAAGTLQLLGPEGTYVTFAAAPDLTASPTLFHSVKLVADPTTGRYVSLYIDDFTYDLSAYTPGGEMPSAPASVLIGITLTSRLGFNDTVYVDDVILTQNEPL